MQSFNPRPHMGGDLQEHPSQRRCGDCFNPRPHMGGDRSILPLTCPSRVSIHAPTWGATTTARLRLLSMDSFNPRPHMGGDIGTELLNLEYNVSIHAPTWGATDHTEHFSQAIFVSIHAPTWGATAACRQWQNGCPGFQSTPPHGGRPNLNNRHYDN